MRTPRATVIICVLDDWRILRLLQSLEHQSFDSDEFEVLVVAAGSEKYDDFLGGFSINVRLIYSDVARLSVQRNIGLAQARGTYYLTTDADCVAHRDWIGSMVSALDASPIDVVAVGGSIKKYSTDTLVREFGITIDDGQSRLGYLPASDMPYVTGANSAYKVASARECGGYDEQFLCGDDVDLSYRLGAHGGKLTLAPDAIIYHQDRSSLAQHFRRFHYYAVDQALLYKKHRRSTRPTVTINPYPWRRFGDSANSFLKGLIPAASGDYSGLSEALVTATEALGVLSGDIEGSVKHGVLYI